MQVFWIRWAAGEDRKYEFITLNKSCIIHRSFIKFCKILWQRANSVHGSTRNSAASGKLWAILMMYGNLYCCLQDGSKLKTLSGHHDLVQSVAFSWSGSYLVCCTILCKVYFLLEVHKLTINNIINHLKTRMIES